LTKVVPNIFPNSASRWLQLGSIKRYQIEDYVMLAVFVS
jgi:hypothetical protein